MHTTTITSHEGVCTTPSIKSALAVPPSRHTAHTHTHQNRRKTDKAPRRPCPAKFEQLCEACNCQNKTKKKHTHTQQPSIPSRKSATNQTHPTHTCETHKKKLSAECLVHVSAHWLRAIAGAGTPINAAKSARPTEPTESAVRIARNAIAKEKSMHFIIAVN